MDDHRNGDIGDRVQNRPIKIVTIKNILFPMYLNKEIHIVGKHSFIKFFLIIIPKESKHPHFHRFNLITEYTNKDQSTIYIH